MKYSNVLIDMQTFERWVEVFLKLYNLLNPTYYHK